MKPNEAPEKIYFSQTEDDKKYFTLAIPFEREFVEYTRTDAFIEKAAEWLERNADDYIMNVYSEIFISTSFVEDFKKAMKL